MPFAYRITKRKYARDLSGMGAYLNGGRWNTPGIYMLYTASSVALATLETLAHIKKEITPVDFALVTLYLPDQTVPKIEDQMELKVGWQDFSSYGLFTRKVGETEVFKNNLYISVPSALTLKDRNYLINPLHQDVGKIKVMEVEDYRFDQRLL